MSVAFFFPFSTLLSLYWPVGSGLMFASHGFFFFRIYDIHLAFVGYWFRFFFIYWLIGSVILSYKAPSGTRRVLGAARLKG